MPLPQCSRALVQVRKHSDKPAVAIVTSAARWSCRKQAAVIGALEYVVPRLYFLERPHEGRTMPKSVAITLATVTVVMGGSQAQAVTFTGTTGLNAAIYEGSVTEEVACRRGSDGRLRCWETSQPYRASPYQSQGYVYQRGNEEYFRQHGGWQYQSGPQWGQPLGDR
jgi:hypothetical protein